MKFSQSILIFLFFSSFSGAFFYAMRRTKGNSFKSLLFALFFLAIKMGLIAPNQQLISSLNKVESPGYHPYLSFCNDYRPSGLLMDSIERSSLILKYSYSQNVIKELRAGDSRVTQAAWLLLTIWMLQQQSFGFQTRNPAPMPPHLELARNLLFGKPKSDQLSGRQYQYRSRTQLEMARTRRRRSVQIINMDEEYEKFLKIKHSDTVCSRERYEELCTDPQRDIIDNASIKEAKIILEAEGRGIAQNVRRPTKDEPNLDFKDDGPGPIEFIDVKEPRNWGKGNEDLESAAIRMGEKIKKQKDNAGDFGIPREKVLHIVNVELLNFDERPDYQKNIYTVNGSDGIVIMDIRIRKEHK